MYACFIDFSKAYDSVWRVGLLYKLILNGLSTKFIHLIKSMYEDLQLSVKLSDGVTPFFDTLLGVRQGCNLSPLLFNLSVNDIFQELKDNSCQPIKLQQKDINCLMYADDLLILSETEAGLNNSLQRLGKYAKRWKLKISQKKTKIMVFNKQGRSIDLKLKVDNLVIESCKKYVYLGIVFIPGNNFRTAQKELYKKACKTLFTYLSVINVHTGAQISTVKKLFDTLVRPVLLYSSEIWGAFLRPKQLRLLRTFSNSLFDDNQNHESHQLKMAKIALNVHKRANNLAVRGEVGMYPLSIEIYKNMIK